MNHTKYKKNHLRGLPIDFGINHKLQQSESDNLVADNKEWKTTLTVERRIQGIFPIKKPLNRSPTKKAWRGELPRIEMGREGGSLQRRTKSENHSH